MGKMADGILSRGRFAARFAATQEDLERAQALRHLAFVARLGTDAARGGAGRDADRFDGLFRHVLVEDRSGKLVCCYRLRLFGAGASLSDSYAAQHHDLSALARQPGPMAEIGRFCIHPGAPDPDILRLAWGALTRLVDAERIGFLFGCTSFEGTDPAPYADVLAALARSHLAPDHWRPRVSVAGAVPLAGADPSGPQRQLPPLMRGYLAMGGKVADHAVTDPALDTLHVFTGVEVAAIPPARARLLRAIATP